MMRFRNMLPALAFVAVTGTAFSAYAGPLYRANSASRATDQRGQR
jgi:hypothetical protein